MNVISRRLLYLTVLVPVLLSACTGAGASYTTLTAEDRQVRIDLSSLGEERGRFFTYHSTSDRKVHILVYLESSGEARAVLSACRTCYRWRKGYRLDGDNVVCRKCGLVFALDELHQGAASCRPIALKAAVEDGKLTIPLMELEKGAKFF